MATSIEVEIAASLDRYLQTRSSAPLAIAFSGGGDSQALLILARAWADRHGRNLVALTVDHGLQAASTEWTRRCAQTAKSFGVGFHALTWEGRKPLSGLAAAARDARHALLADAARAIGARVILMGHTADDRLEAALMRQEGSTAGDPRPFAPSPAWPQGRGVFLVRPMLSVRRAALRAWLHDQGVSWIDDPANSDPRSARARARARLGLEEDPPPIQTRQTAPNVAVDAQSGLITLPRTAACSHLAAACLCAAGTTATPRGGRLDRLTERLSRPGVFVASLAGARIEAGEAAIAVMREAGEWARVGSPQTPLPQGVPTVWDGRFELTADRPGLVARPLKGLAASLPAATRTALLALPPALRPTLPAVLNEDGAATCPIFTGPISAGPIVAGDHSVRVVALAPARFAAAVGIVNREPVG